LSRLDTVSGGRCDLASTQDVEEILALAAAEGIVGLSVVVLLEVGFEPLAELEVVLVLGLGELADFDVALDAVLVEGVLQDFVVLHEFVLVLGIPLDLAEGERARVQGVHDGAVDTSRGALLNFCEVQLEAG
jgi:hypothetical protein